MEIIKLAKYGNSLNTRPLADDIFMNLASGDITIDFSGVDIATPSFLHEMLLILIKNKNGKPQIINTNSSVLGQLDKAYYALNQK